MKGMKSILKPSFWGRFPITVALLWGTSIYAKAYSISGRAFNEAGKKIGPVRIVLYDLDKRKVIELETPASGKFKFKNIPDGNYTMNVYGEGGYGATKNFSVSGSNISDVNPALNPDLDQVQVSVKNMENGAKCSWKKTPGAVEFVIYRDNNEVGRTSETFYLDAVDPGQTFAYNVTAVKSDQSLGTRSITEYGKTLMPIPENVIAEAKKNIIKLSWDAVKNASAYNVYRDGELVNSTSENSFADFKLKYGTKFAYTVATLDHQSEPGSKSADVFITTHLEIAKPKGLKAESGENQVMLNWKVAKNSVKYYVYQNSILVDSTNGLSAKVKTEAGTENCFSVAGVDQYGSVGAKSDAACDKSVFSAPDSIVVSFDKRNNHLIKWSQVEGASSYNLYTNGKLQTNTEKLEISLKSLKWETDYTYYLTSLTDDGKEGPKSSDYTVRTPKYILLKDYYLMKQEMKKM